MAVLNFAYTALDAAGAKKTGSIEAETQQAAVAHLAAEGRYVMEIREATSRGAQQTTRMGGRAPSRQDIALFTRRMADLASAGLPLDRVLAVTSEQSENMILKQVAEDALTDVRAGTPVSQALAKYPQYFPQVYTMTLRSGEASGQFGTVAERLAEYLEKEVARRSQVASAMVYPVLLATMSIFVIIFLMTFVVPRLSGVFKDMGTDLPITTKILLATADFASQHGIVILICIAVFVLAMRIWLKTDHGAETRDRFMLHAPLLGPVVTKATISRFARILGTLVYGGVPILEALEISGMSANNRVFLKSALAVEEEVRAGRPIADAMRDAGEFPPVLTHMVSVGEETGDLPKMLTRVSDSLDFEVETGMRRLVSLVEPVIVLSLGTFVGFVVLSVLLPIYQASNLVK